MTPLFKKLNYKENTPMLVLNSPLSFEKELNDMGTSATIIKDENKVEFIDFALVFVTKQTQVDEYTDRIAPKLRGDATLWFCYPKGTSKKYTCDFNRDTGWSKIRKYDMDTVRQVAIDEDWSALRFRKNEFIKSVK